MRNEPVPKLRKLAQRKGKSFIKCRAQGNAHELTKYSHSLFFLGFYNIFKIFPFFVLPEIKNAIKTGLMEIFNRFVYTSRDNVAIPARLS